MQSANEVMAFRLSGAIARHSNIDGAVISRGGDNHSFSRPVARRKKAKAIVLLIDYSYFAIAIISQ